MKLKQVLLLALTVCTVIVMASGLARANFTQPVAASVSSPSFLIAQDVPVQSGSEEQSPEGQSPEEQSDSADVTAVDEATQAHLQQGGESLPTTPEIRRTVIQEDYALVTWSWGDAGGQTALSLVNEEWTVLTSGGGAVDVSVLQAAGVPIDIAQQLVASDRASW